ncbi:MAG: hypothetical protein Q8N26_28650 [Myxococcales bacterium]|nr:hypothetical protein [Myxococcales bacterium]
MDEHSYSLRAAATTYVDAFFAKETWEEVERRFERAQAALKVLATR